MSKYIKQTNLVERNGLRQHGADGLAKAIVLQACQDYVDLRKTGFISRAQMAKTDSNRKKIESDLERFFGGTWIKKLCDTPSQVLLDRLGAL